MQMHEIARNIFLAVKAHEAALADLPEDHPARVTIKAVHTRLNIARRNIWPDWPSFVQYVLGQNPAAFSGGGSKDDDPPPPGGN